MKQLAFPLGRSPPIRRRFQSQPRGCPIGRRLISNYPRGAAAVSSDERWTGGGEGDGSTKLADRDTEREGRGEERTTRTCGRRTKYLFSSSEGVGEGINK